MVVCQHAGELVGMVGGRGRPHGVVRRRDRPTGARARRRRARPPAGHRRRLRARPGGEPARSLGLVPLTVPRAPSPSRSARAPSPAPAGPTRRPRNVRHCSMYRPRSSAGSAMRPPGATHATGAPSSQATRSSSVELTSSRPESTGGACASREGTRGTSTGAVRNAASSPLGSSDLAGRARERLRGERRRGRRGGEVLRREVRGGAIDVTSKVERALRRPAELGVQGDLVVRARRRRRGRSHEVEQQAAHERPRRRPRPGRPPAPASPCAARVATSTRRVAQVEPPRPLARATSPRPPKAARRRAAARRAAREGRPPRPPGRCPRPARGPGARSGPPASAAPSPAAATNPPDSTNRARVCDASMVMRASASRLAASMALALTSAPFGAGGPRPRAERPASRSQPSSLLSVRGSLQAPSSRDGLAGRVGRQARSPRSGSGRRPRVGARRGRRHRRRGRDVGQRRRLGARLRARRRVRGLHRRRAAGEQRQAHRESGDRRSRVTPSEVANDADAGLERWGAGHVLGVDEDDVGIGVVREHHVTVRRLVVEGRDDVSDAREVRGRQALERLVGHARVGLEHQLRRRRRRWGSRGRAGCANVPVPMSGRSRPVR